MNSQLPSKLLSESRELVPGAGVSLSSFKTLVATFVSSRFCTRLIGFQFHRHTCNALKPGLFAVDGCSHAVLLNPTTVVLFTLRRGLHADALIRRTHSNLVLFSVCTAQSPCPPNLLSPDPCLRPHPHFILLLLSAIASLFYFPLACPLTCFYILLLSFYIPLLIFSHLTDLCFTSVNVHVSNSFH